ncbi:MAG: hypothetical protein ABH851_01560 [Methanobacteriota archaeon]
MPIVMGAKAAPVPDRNEYLMKDELQKMKPDAQARVKGEMGFPDRAEKWAGALRSALKSSMRLDAGMDYALAIIGSRETIDKDSNALKYGAEDKMERLETVLNTLKPEQVRQLLDHMANNPNGDPYTIVTGILTEPSTLTKPME